MKNDDGCWFEAVEGFADGQTDEQTFVIVHKFSQKLANVGQKFTFSIKKGNKMDLL